MLHALVVRAAKPGAHNGWKKKPRMLYDTAVPGIVLLISVVFSWSYRVLAFFCLKELKTMTSKVTATAIRAIATWGSCCSSAPRKKRGGKEEDDKEGEGDKEEI